MDPASQGADWQRRDASEWVVENVEALGSNGAAWLVNPDSEERWLHKNTVTPGSTLFEQGEDWSELVSTAVGAALGVPCAEVRLCLRSGTRGTLSKDVRPSGYDLLTGRSWLQTHLPDYDGARFGEDGVRRPGHNLAVIRTSLEDVNPPPNTDFPTGVGAFDVFAGFLVLDSLIANQDRHDENWAVLRPSLNSGTVSLAPSYDHASSLGFKLTDAQFRAELDRGIEVWASKGRAKKFAHTNSAPTLVEHAASALEMCSSPGADWWRERLRAVELGPIMDRLDSGTIPEMSDSARIFVRCLITENLRRLRDETNTNA